MRRLGLSCTSREATQNDAGDQTSMFDQPLQFTVASMLAMKEMLFPGGTTVGRCEIGGPMRSALNPQAQCGLERNTKDDLGLIF